MPYWEVFTPENAFTPEDKEQLSQARDDWRLLSQRRPATPARSPTRPRPST